MKTVLPPHFSIYLDFIRVIAATVVLISHYPITAWQADITNRYNFAFDAVIVFFVLSGYVITFATDQSDNKSTTFIAHRAARILPTSIAAVILSLLLMIAGSFIRPELYPELYQLSAVTFNSLISIFFLGEIWWLHITPFQNGPYWSLTFEVWCYVFFGFMVFARGWKRVVLMLVTIAVAGPKLLIFLPIWLCGVACYSLTKSSGAILRRPLQLTACLAAPAIIFFIVQLSQPRDWSYFYIGSKVEAFLGRGLDGAANFGWGYLLAIMFTLHLYAAYNLPGMFKIFTHPKVSSVIKKLASYTFSLYIFHYPIIIFFRAILGHQADGYDLSYRMTIYVLTLTCVYFPGNVFEQSKNFYRDLFLRAVSSTKRHFTLNTPDRTV